MSRRGRDESDLTLDDDVLEEDQEEEDFEEGEDVEEDDEQEEEEEQQEDEEAEAESYEEESQVSDEPQEQSYDVDEEDVEHNTTTYTEQGSASESVSGSEAADEETKYEAEEQHERVQPQQRKQQPIRVQEEAIEDQDVTDMHDEHEEQPAESHAAEARKEDRASFALSSTSATQPAASPSFLSFPANTVSSTNSSISAFSAFPSTASFQFSNQSLQPPQQQQQRPSQPAPQPTSLSVPPAPSPSPSPSPSSSYLPVVSSVSESGSQSLSLQVPLSTKSVASSWGRGHELILFADQRNNHNASQRLPSSKQQTEVVVFRWRHIYGEASILLHNWAAIFWHMQQQAHLQQQRHPHPHAIHKLTTPSTTSTALLSPVQWRSFLLTQSRCYRAELEACLYRAAQSMSSPSLLSYLSTHQIPIEAYHSHLMLLESMGSIWHLMEIVYLDPHLNLTAQLVDWLHRSIKPAEITEDIQVDSEEWWIVILQLAAHGRIQEMVQILSTAIPDTTTTNTTTTNTAASTAPFAFIPRKDLHRLLELVQSIPSLTSHPNSLAELLSLHQQYQSMIRALAISSTSGFRQHPYFPILLDLLAGDVSVIVEVCDNWIEVLVAQLIYMQPHCTKQELPELVIQCVTYMQEKKQQEAAAEKQSDTNSSSTSAAAASVTTTPLDQVRQDILCFRLIPALLLAGQMHDLPYFTAHLVDLLTHAQVVPNLSRSTTTSKQRQDKKQQKNNITKEEDSPLSFRDWYVWQYISSICYDEQLWTLTPTYLQTLSTTTTTTSTTTTTTAPTAIVSEYQPIHALSTLLLTQSIQSSSQLLQYLSIAHAYHLPSLIGHRLIYSFATLMLRQQEVGTAVYWLSHAGPQGKQRVIQILQKLLYQLIHPVHVSSSSNGFDGDFRASQGELIDSKTHLFHGDHISMDTDHHTPSLYPHIHPDHHSDTASIGAASAATITTTMTADDTESLEFELRAILENLPVDTVFDTDLPVELRLAQQWLQYIDYRKQQQETSTPDAAETVISPVQLLHHLCSMLITHTPQLPTPKPYQLPLLSHLYQALQQLGEQVLLSVQECQALLTMLNDSEMSWMQREWRKGLSDKEVHIMRHKLMQELQAAVVMEESGRRRPP